MYGQADFSEHHASPAAAGPTETRGNRHVSHSDGGWTSPQPVSDTWPPQQPATSSSQPPSAEYPPARGTLPVSVQNPDGNDTPARRTTVTFTTPAPEVCTKQPEQAHGPPTDPSGLENFDLGFVPASVTPPTTWRKAAWFAALSSSGVVVALTVAGSVLVNQPEQYHSLDGWPDRNDRTPMLPGEGYTEEKDPASDTASSTSPRNDTSHPDESHGGNHTAGVQTTASQPSTSVTGAEAPQQTSGPPTSSSPETSSSEPQKPSATPASTSQVIGLLSLSDHDAEDLSEDSQDYFNTVTEDFESAFDMTNGELADEGSAGLRNKYSGIAYFEVQHVVIDSSEGITINTVEVTHQDGTKTEQTRTLAFNQDGEIVEDSVDDEKPLDGSSTTTSPDEDNDDRDDE